ncbi:transposable element tc3 transposase [Lasius niger]|uniref:Transposable element tc3 transposase n=1 Tax=Lasius niger TaxID=67767 RepID=A0A0J7KA59_LASNI|nr:transposable element tc3 transposase [Lasius niger]
MSDYPPQERIDMLLILGDCRINYRQAAALYQVRYPNRRHPNAAVIRDIYLRAQQGNLVRRRQSHGYDENDVRVLVVLAAVYLNPHISSYQMERQTGIPRTTILRILRHHGYHPYHITLMQVITTNDMRMRLQFCRWAFVYYVMFSDEATFENSGQLKRHNCHYWADVKPFWYRQIDNQHRWSINVWCDIINGYLIGPYIFDGNVNGQNFSAFLRNELPGLLEDVDLYTRLRMWIQLDGVPPHYARIVRNYLNRRYNGM